MAPFPSTQVIPTGWSQHHAPVARGAMTGTCTISTGGAGGWDPTTGPTPGTPGVLYAGRPCRVQSLARGDRAADAAGQAVAQHPYLVAIEHDAPDIPTGARVHIDTCPDDPALVGKTLTVAATQYGTARFERDLLCDLDPANQGA